MYPLGALVGLVCTLSGLGCRAEITAARDAGTSEDGTVAVERDTAGEDVPARDTLRETAPDVPAPDIPAEASASAVDTFDAAEGVAAADGEAVVDAMADGGPRADIAEVAADAASTAADATEPGPSDTIFGVIVPRADSWWVDGGRIHRGAAVVRLRGINWFGLESTDRALHGTWTGRTVESFLAEIRSLGFDSLRIPLSPESINPGFAASAWALNAYQSGPAATGREQLEHLLDAAAGADFTLLLDFHTCNPSQIGGALPGRPDGCPGYDPPRWLADLETLASLAVGREHVLGIDLSNEPFALTWRDWKAFAERGAEVVLRRNPHILVFVEGVAALSDDAGAAPFWGENLTEAATVPPAIPASRLVFSPHTYGPGVLTQSYFSVADFPANMPAIWTSHFGRLALRYALVVGEFGGQYDDAYAPGEVAWNEAFVAYLMTLDRGGPASFYYWVVNPNSGDTGGLYSDDWSTLVDRRLRLLAPLLGR